MIDREYCARMKPLIKLQLVFVGGFLLLPLLIAAIVYVSSAFGYCQAYTLANLDLYQPYQHYFSVDNGVTAIISHSATPSMSGFKVKSSQSEKLYQITTNKPLFPCSRFEGSLNLATVDNFYVNNAAILSLTVENLNYVDLFLDTSYTISKLYFINCSAQSLVFYGTGSLNYSGKINSADLSAASSVFLDVDFQGGKISAELTGGFYGYLSNFSSVLIYTVGTGTKQHVCVPHANVMNHCVSTLNKYWNGNSGIIYVRDNEQICRYTKYSVDECPEIFTTSKSKDVLYACFGEYSDYDEAGEIVSLDNRGEALIYVYDGEKPDFCQY